MSTRFLIGRLFSKDRMVLYSALLFSTLLYVCSSLKFLNVERGNTSANNFGLDWKRSDSDIYITGRASPPESVMNLLLSGGNLFATSHEFSFCIYRAARLEGCYQEPAKILTLKLSPGDALFLVHHSDKDAISAALQKKDARNMGYWRNFDGTSKEFFVVPIKGSDQSTLTFSEPIRGNPSATDPELVLEWNVSDISLTKEKLPPKPVISLMLKGGNLLAASHEFSFCIHRAGKLEGCYQEPAKMLTLKLMHDDVLFLVHHSDKDAISAALQKKDARNMGYWRNFDGTKNEFFVVSIKGEDKPNKSVTLKKQYGAPQKNTASQKSMTSQKSTAPQKSMAPQRRNDYSKTNVAPQGKRPRSRYDGGSKVTDPTKSSPPSDVKRPPKKKQRID